MQNVSQPAGAHDEAARPVLVHTSNTSRKQIYDYGSIPADKMQASVVAQTKQYLGRDYNKVRKTFVAFVTQQAGVTLECFEFFLGMRGISGHVLSLNLIREWKLENHITGFPEAWEEWLSQPSED